MVFVYVIVASRSARRPLSNSMRSPARNAMDKAVNVIIVRSFHIPPLDNVANVYRTHMRTWHFIFAARKTNRRRRPICVWLSVYVFSGCATQFMRHELDCSCAQLSYDFVCARNLLLGIRDRERLFNPHYISCTQLYAECEHSKLVFNAFFVSPSEWSTKDFAFSNDTHTHSQDKTRASAP